MRFSFLCELMHTSLAWISQSLLRINSLLFTSQFTLSAFTVMLAILRNEQQGAVKTFLMCLLRHMVLDSVFQKNVMLSFRFCFGFFFFKKTYQFQEQMIGEEYMYVQNNVTDFETLWFNLHLCTKQSLASGTQQQMYNMSKLTEITPLSTKGPNQMSRHDSLLRFTQSFDNTVGHQNHAQAS